MTLEGNSILWHIPVQNVGTIYSTRNNNNVLKAFWRDKYTAETPNCNRKHGRRDWENAYKWKRIFGHIWTAKAQISLHIRAVWSVPSLSAIESLDTAEYECRAKSRMILCAWAGGFEYAHFAHVQKDVSLDSAQINQNIPRKFHNHGT